MLHHTSLNARDPDRVAHGLAELTGARALLAPCPPFPHGSWFVCAGDAAGSLIEVLPWGAVRDPNGRGGAANDAEMRPYSGGHLLVGTPHGVETVLAIAAREGWRAELGDAGLFRFVKVWLENAYLLELLPPELRADYIAAFDTRGLQTLDRKLRELEATIRSAIRA